MIDGQPHVMRLTLALLAELETDMQSDSLMDMVSRFETGKFSARDILAVLKAGLRGGGMADVPELNVDGGAIVAAKAAAQLLKVTFAMPDA